MQARSRGLSRPASIPFSFDASNFRHAPQPSFLSFSLSFTLLSHASPLTRQLLLCQLLHSCFFPLDSNNRISHLHFILLYRLYLLLSTSQVTQFTRTALFLRSDFLTHDPLQFIPFSTKRNRSRNKSYIYAILLVHSG
jgi:hypothetical protein